MSIQSSDELVEYVRRRMLWMKNEVKLREHERLKQKMIEEYERKRAEELELNRKRKSPCRYENRSSSRFGGTHHHSQTKHMSSRSQVMPEILNSSEGNKSIFNGPEEAPKFNEPAIVVTKHRKITASGSETNEIRRNIVNHEEITLKRRHEEGSKPIFDREEIKQFESKSIEEHRTIRDVRKNNLVEKSSSYTKRRSVSLSPRRHRSPSPRADSNTYTHRSRLNSSEGNKSIFNGPEEAPKFNEPAIVVTKHRKITASGSETNEIRRNIVNHEEITLKRRHEEGSKPIFDREEIKQFESKSIEEHRTIRDVRKNNLVEKSSSYTKRRSVSLSPRRHRSPSPRADSNTYTHRSRHNSSEGNKSIFNGPEEAPKFNEPAIVVTIHRKITASGSETNEIRRNIVNHEEITLKRRHEEGSKPIFDREEIKQFESKSIEQHRTIRDVRKNNLVEKSSSYTKRRSVSLSPRRHRSPSPRADSNTYTHRSRSSRSDEEYKYHVRSEDRTHGRRDRRDSFRERILLPAQYVELVETPIYSPGFAPRPMLAEAAHSWVHHLVRPSRRHNSQDHRRLYWNVLPDPRKSFSLNREAVQL
ncbi:uncharacterized protein LOC116417962 [Nasonia vitripennis]|uniref:Complementary sex determination N-terminal domain-containing protein n=1 Tax=Nasonia vitripennis TaxID=7425 RepID=A0A7M7QPT3_NASVI|nr:uncharacterized protein LOC116417962 [Nasonia vitripennis]